jgi:hypothetical protein
LKILNLKLKISIILLLPFMLLIKELLYLKPDITEKLFSRLIYPPIGKTLSKLSGILPFSLAEILFFTVIGIAVIFAIRFIYALLRSKNKLSTILNGLVNLLCVLSIGYCLFLLLWGFNYYRQPLAYSLGYNIEKSTVADLEKLCSVLIDKTNQLRMNIAENESGIMTISGGFKSVRQRSDIGYKSLSTDYPFLGSSFGKPKGIILSHPMCYTGISGIYFPFTGEANVNTMVPYSMLPSTACHEMAHQRGFAREDEANFIAYLTCKAHKDVDFQYSGYLLAAIYSMNALYQYDVDKYHELALTYNEGVKRDLKHDIEFWKQFEGPVEELQEKINDTYLKSNKQSDGIYSYGRMVDLLLAEQKTNNTR